MRAQRWQDWVMLAFGIWLFVSPFWMLVYGSLMDVAAWNSYVMGVLVAVFAWGALAGARRWEEWLQLIFGVWLIVSPFVLMFYAIEPTAAWNTIALGILIGLDAIWALAAYARQHTHISSTM